MFYSTIYIVYIVNTYQVLLFIIICFTEPTGWSGLDSNGGLSLYADPTNRDYLVENDGIELTVKSLTRWDQFSFHVSRDLVPTCRHTMPYRLVQGITYHVQCV